MTERRPRRISATLILLLGLGAGLVSLPGARGGTRAVDPSLALPLDQIASTYREGVAEVLRDATLHRKGAPETFPCDPKLYLSLLGEPALTLALWKDLSDNPVKLRQIGPNRYLGTNDAGANATGEFVLRTPRLHVLFGEFSCQSPRGAFRLDGRIVLIVRSGYFREVNGDFWVQHELETFIKLDSKGWKTVARTTRPWIEKYMEEQVQEAGLFVSLMSRLVTTYPNWACQVCMDQPQLPASTRQTFCDLVALIRKPGASTGRPQLAANAPAARR